MTDAKKAVVLKTKVRLRQPWRHFGFEVRRLQGGEVVDPLPLISFWLNRLDYFRRRMEDITSIDGDKCFRRETERGL